MKSKDKLFKVVKTGSKRPIITIEKGGPWYNNAPSITNKQTLVFNDCHCTYAWEEFNQ